MRLPAPTTKAGADGLRALIAAPARALVGLDFDGTLAPIVDDPQQARPIAGATDAIRRLAGYVDTVAIVTGRPAQSAVDLLGFDLAASPNLVVLGHYGLERWTPAVGVVRRDADDAAIEAVRATLPGLLAEAGAPAGTAIEDKQSSLAVHVRRTADPAAALHRLRPVLSKLAADHGLRLEPGRLVLELRPSGIDKGLALEALVRERAVDVVCYAGDDRGDLAAFDALTRLRATGKAALAVCSASDEVPELARRADIVVAGPAGLVEFLRALCAALEDAA